MWFTFWSCCSGKDFLCAGILKYGFEDDEIKAKAMAEELCGTSSFSEHSKCVPMKWQFYYKSQDDPKSWTAIQSSVFHNFYGCCFKFCGGMFFNVKTRQSNLEHLDDIS